MKSMQPERETFPFEKTTDDATSQSDKNAISENRPSNTSSVSVNINLKGLKGIIKKPKTEFKQT